MRVAIFCLMLGFSLNTLAQSNPEKVKNLFAKLSKDNMAIVEEFYHPEIKFIDSVGELQGIEQMKAYYKQMYENVKSVKFDFTDIHEAGPHVIAVWKMTLETDKLKGGEPIEVEGNSVIKFNEDGKAIYHRDYFDMGAFVYENIPVLGFVIRKIKDRFKVEK